MFIELKILYPFKQSREEIIKLLTIQKDTLLKLKKCNEYLLNEDTYSDKIVCIIKWETKEHMKTSVSKKDYKKNLEKMVKLQKFPPEIYYLNEIDSL